VAPTATASSAPSTRRLSEVARHVVIPSGIVDTLWFKVEKQCAEWGDEFDPWQDGLGQLALGLREDGTFAATVGGITLSIPRQVAKTFIVGRIVFALCILFPNLTVLWTAHRTRTATQTFNKLKGLAKKPGIKPHMAAGGGIRSVNGEQEFEFANGSKIMFGAREQGFGRGFDEVDIEVFDEAQILTEKALEDMVAATNQSRFQFGALLFFMGTPPRPIDPGEEFSNRRREALALKPGGVVIATGEDSLYVECSADPDCGKPGGPSLDDPKQVEIANPSVPSRTPWISIKRLRKQLTNPDSWRREGLGIWDDLETLSAFAHWPKLKAAVPTDPIVHALGIATDRDQTWLSLGAVIESDHPHLAVVDRCRATARKAFAAKVARIQRERSCEVLIRGKNFIIPDLEEAGVTLRLVDSFERAQAHADLSTAIENGEIEHGDYPELNAAVGIAQWRPTETGRSLDARAGDISALDAVALALHGAESGANYDPLASVL
jgi:hypothetical protein